jgi:VWFA-related protein
MKAVNRFAISLPVLLLCMVVLSVRSSSQTAPDQSQNVLHSDQTLHANTRLVVVDVVATDSKGHAVPDLKAEDFTLLEDGKPQKISGFTFERPGTAAVRTEQVQLPPSVISNAPKFQANSLNVILFDAINGDFVEHSYAKSELLKFLNSAALDRPVAMFAMQDQLKLLHDFTTDNKALVSAVTKYKPPTEAISTDTMESKISAFSSAGAFHTSERGIADTLNQLNALAKTLAGYPGRKNLIWLSGSIPLVFFPEEVNRADGHISLKSGDAFDNMLISTSFKSYADLIKKVTDSFMAAQVAVYVVDAGTLSKDDHLSAQITMDLMADGTGGKAFRNSNNLALNLKTSMEDGSTFYTLGYYPDNKKWDGQFRRIQVKSNRPGLTLRHRVGYYALDPEKLNKENSDAVAENFSRSLELDAPANSQVVFQAQVVPPSTNGKKVTVTFHIDPGTMAFEHEEGGIESARLSCTVWAYGKDKNKPTMSSGTVSANLKAGEYQQMMQQHFLPCNRELDLKSGTYTLRMGVLDRTTNKMGTASAQVIVP